MLYPVWNVLVRISCINKIKREGFVVTDKTKPLLIKILENC